MWKSFKEEFPKEGQWVIIISEMSDICPIRIYNCIVKFQRDDSFDYSNSIWTEHPRPELMK